MKFRSKNVAVLTCLIGVLVLSLGVWGGTAHAATFIVSELADTNDGVCNADCSLREAIDAANSDGVDSKITFKSGLSGIIQLSSALPDLSTNINLQGPGATQITVRGEGTADPYRIFVTAAVDTISGLTIANGAGVNVGGGICNNLGTLTVRNCTFDNNNAGDGGGLYNNKVITVDNCKFFQNSADFGGGGFANDGYQGNVQATITNCTFEGNTTGGAGAAILNTGSGSVAISGAATLSVNGSTFKQNVAQNNGGALFNVGDDGSVTLTVSNSTFDFNSASNGNGGAILCAATGGVATTTLTNSTFSNNAASNRGGAFYNVGTGGAVKAAVKNCTFNVNNAAFGGSAIWSSGPTTSTVKISNNIFGVGTQGITLADDSNGSLISQGYNLASDGGGGYLTATGDQINIADLKLVSLADNGGPTQTMALQIDSPAINAGNSLLKFDQRGIARPQGSASDIGAFEFEKVLTVSIAPSFSSTFAENVGPGATTVRITRGGDLTAALPVSLHSSDTSEATIQSSATILAGNSFVDVPVDAVDDNIADGPQSVLLKATAADYAWEKATLNVNDNEAAQVALILRLLPAAFSENKAGTAATLVIQHNAVSTAGAVTVNLSSNDARLDLPASVQIPVGKRSVEVAVTVTADNLLTGTKTATITAGATNFTPANTTATIYDAQARIMLSLAPGQSSTIKEGVTNNQTTLRVTRNTPSTGALVVMLSLNKGAGQVSYPPSVTIADGASYAEFVVSSVDDNAVDGTQSVVVQASATGYGTSTAQLYVQDNDAANFSLSKATDEPSQ